MSAIVNGARSRSTVLTGMAGLLLLVTAVVMMVCAAPRIHAVRHGSVTHEQLASRIWVTRDHGFRVTPGTVGELSRSNRALVP
jgi:type IV secretory pathway VirB3-like protein